MKPRGEKQCGLCKETLPIKSFGICRARSDGRNLYCPSCALDQVHASRSRKRLRKAAQRAARAHLVVVERKPNIIAAERVKTAIERGAKTIESIQRATKLKYDFLGELLAEMVWESKTVKIERRPEGREFHLAA